MDVIVKATDRPFIAGFDDRYAEPGETIRPGIEIGAGDANVEDRLKPFDEFVARVRAIITAAEDVPSQLNAQTDAVAKGTGPLPGRPTGAIASG